MKRVQFFVGVATLMVVALAFPSRAAETIRPNIVFIMADDLGWADVAYNGGTAPTPHLDRLARENVQLTQHYSAPVCSPTRTGLLSGRFWSRFGITNPDNRRAFAWDTVTLPRALKSVGYNTCLTGKWHLGSLPEQGPNKFGFDHSYGSLAGGVGPWDHHYKEGPFMRTWHRNCVLLEEKGHVTDLIANEAIGWMRQQTKAAPFFLYVPFTAVHLPVKEPAEWVARVPKSIMGEVPRQYAASIMHLDDAVGRILAAIAETGQRDRTIVVFTSDNGGSDSENAGQEYPKDDYPAGKIPGNNGPFRGMKGDVYDGGIHSTALVSWPGVLTARKTTAPCHISDWMPTFCALAGYKPEKDLKWDGANIWPVITGEGRAPTRPLYWVGPGFRDRALREGDWKLVVIGRAGREKTELFNLADDPYEKKNLANSMAERLAAMKERLAVVARADRDAEVKEAGGAKPD